MGRRITYWIVAILTLIEVGLLLIIVYTFWNDHTEITLSNEFSLFILWLPCALLSIVFQILFLPKREKSRMEESMLEEGVFDVIEKKGKRIPFVLIAGHFFNAVALSIFCWVLFYQLSFANLLTPIDDLEDVLLAAFVALCVAGHFVLYWQLIDYWLKRQIELSKQQH